MAKVKKPMHEVFKREYLLHFPYKCQKCGELISIGLYKCRICGRPISDHQFAFSGICGSCDVGNKATKTWTIRCKPSENFDWITFHDDLNRAISNMMYESNFQSPKTSSPIINLLKHSFEKMKEQEKRDEK